jgi:hypothetical protein
MGEMMKTGGELTIEDTKDFGSVGCYTMKVAPGVLGIPKPLHGTACFQLSGGYLILTLGSEDPDQVSYDVVKRFLEKAAARRK